MGHEHRSPEIEGQGHKSRSKVKVKSENAVGATSTEGNSSLRLKKILTECFRIFGQNGLAAICIELVPVVRHFKWTGVDQNRDYNQQTTVTLYFTPV